MKLDTIRNPENVFLSQLLVTVCFEMLGVAGVKNVLATPQEHILQISFCEKKKTIPKSLGVNCD